MKWGLTSKDGKWVEQCWFTKDGIGVDLTADPKDALAFKTDQEAVAVRDALPQGQIAWTVLRLPESFNGDDLRKELTVLLLGQTQPASNENLMERVYRLVEFYGNAKANIPVTSVKTEPAKPSLPCPHCGGKGSVKVAQNGKLVEQTCSPCKGKGS